jgi:hypothetical protein
MIRVSRLDYDKAHRCPTWSGGGWRGSDRHCDGSFASFIYERRHWRWRFTRCHQCDVVCLPYVTRWLDPSWLWWYHGQRRKTYSKWPYNRSWPI